MRKAAVSQRFRSQRPSSDAPIYCVGRKLPDNSIEVTARGLSWERATRLLDKMSDEFAVRVEHDFAQRPR